MTDLPNTSSHSEIASCSLSSFRNKFSIERERERERESYNLLAFKFKFYEYIPVNYN